MLLLAVYPDDANTVYLRLSSSTGGDALLVTTDGGQTTRTLLQLASAFSGFVLASDRTLYVGTASGQLWSRSALATQFTLHDGPLLRCLGERAGRLYACGDGLRDGFNLGVSDDGGSTFKPLLKFSDIQGPLSCEPAQTACANDWLYLQRVLSVTPKAGGSGCRCGSAGGAGAAAAGLAALALARGIARRRRAAAGRPPRDRTNS